MVAGVGVGVGVAVVLLVVIMSVLGSGSVLCVEKAHFQNGTTCNIGKWRYGSLRQLLVLVSCLYVSLLYASSLYTLKMFTVTLPLA